jgi:hypothetical protein
MPDTADQDLLAFRRSPRYRASIWAGRLGQVLVLGGLLWMVVDTADGRSVVQYVLWSVGWVAVVASIALLHMAGFRAQLKRSREATRDALLRDAFGPRP